MLDLGVLTASLSLQKSIQDSPEVGSLHSEPRPDREISLLLAESLRLTSLCLLREASEVVLWPAGLCGHGQEPRWVTGGLQLHPSPRHTAVGMTLSLP